MNGIIIRPATTADAKAIARLAAQLGYTVMESDVNQRLVELGQQADHAVYVAAAPGEEAVGWIHLYIDHSLLHSPLVALGGIVVDQAYRGQGIGRRLMEQAETWGREHHCTAVYLKTNVIRHEAHAFYESLGYRNVKTQYAYHKTL
ncbi:MAG: GNAT family N-acetyltransferase [Anaerolineae bacterium]